MNRTYFLNGSLYNNIFLRPYSSHCATVYLARVIRTPGQRKTFMNLYSPSLYQLSYHEKKQKIISISIKTKRSVQVSILLPRD